MTYQSAILPSEANQKLKDFEQQIMQLAKEHFVQPLYSKNIITAPIEKIIKKSELSIYDEIEVEKYAIAQLKLLIFYMEKDFSKRIEDEKKKEAERLLEKQRQEEVERKKLQERLHQEALSRQQELEKNSVYIEWKKQEDICKKYDDDIGNYWEYHRLNFKLGEFDQKQYEAKKLPKEVIVIADKLSTKTRISAEEILWLNTIGRKENLFTKKLRIVVYRLEANYYLGEYKTNSTNYWSAINASSNLRKCEASTEAEKFLENTNIENLKDKKLCSAYFTTLGGVKRDLSKSNEAIECGNKAHKLIPNDYRPCTLLGAVYMERREYDLGHEWYEKAAERGAPSNIVDSEIRSIVLKIKKTADRNTMIDKLMKLDVHKYQWLEKLKLKDNNSKAKKKVE